MKLAPDPSRTITNPTTFLVEDYAPGLSIDFRAPPATTDLQRVRESVDFEPWRRLSLDAQIECADTLCRELGITERAHDFREGLRDFTQEDDLAKGLECAARMLTGAEDTGETVDQLRTIFHETGMLQGIDHFPVRLYCHDPASTTSLEAGHTHFGYVLDGETIELVWEGRSYPLYVGAYFCIPGEAELRGNGRVEILTRFDHLGLLSIGGQIEPWGRLNYIDGCTSTLLVPPARRGDPCYNALYFPSHTFQTQHVHPSLRAGIVIQGKGICKTPHGDHALEPGKIFFLPPETWHSFHTEEAEDGDERAALTVLAFHPDSDFGPTDEDHPMLNRTYFYFLHRLRSAFRLKQCL